MKIVIMMEGDTEKVFLPVLRKYLEKPLSGNMPKIKGINFRGRISKEKYLKKDVQRLLRDCDAVIALTDVYTGTNPPDFKSAADAKKKMKEWVGNEEKFYPHAAQYDFEAWLIPYWKNLQNLAGSNVSVPGDNPETINHQNPPSKRIKEMFLSGKKGKKYVKARDAGRVLRDTGLSKAIESCSELRALVNTIIELCR